MNSQNYLLNKITRFVRTNFKKTTFGLILLNLLLSLSTILKAQESYEQTITKTAQFQNASNAGNKFQVLNINGSVTIEAYNGNTVKLTAAKHYEGSQSEIEQAKRDFTVELVRKGNTIFAYLDAPFVDVDFDGDDMDYDFNDMDNDRDYEFNIDIHALVPRHILVEASTMNEGSVTVIGSFKNIHANNLNGDLKLKDITSKVSARTLNGDIDVVYTERPTADSEFNTLNGHIDVTVPANLSADIYFKSLHGDFYTNFKDFKRLNEDGDAEFGLVKYVVGSFTPIRIGRGDVELRFKVLNGDVYLRKQ